jgi:hypothetical protein
MMEAELDSETLMWHNPHDGVKDSIINVGSQRHSHTADRCSRSSGKLQLLHNSPNVVVEWLALLLRIWDVPVSNLGPGDQLSKVLRDFPQSIHVNAEIVP